MHLNKDDYTLYSLDPAASRLTFLKLVPELVDFMLRPRHPKHTLVMHTWNINFIKLIKLSFVWVEVLRPASI